MAGATERLLLSAVVHSGHLGEALAAGVHEDWWTSHQDEWQWVLDYHRRHRKPPSPPLFELAWPGVISTPEQGTVAPHEVSHLCDTLRNEYLAVCIRRIGRDAASRLKEGATAETVLEEMTATIGRTSATSSSDVRHETDLSSGWNIVLDEVTRRYDRAQRGQAGVKTGLTTIDSHTGGPMPGDLWVVAARLGQGKSWILTKMAAAAALSGATVQFNALEMSRAQMGMRIQAVLANDLGLPTVGTTALLQGAIQLPSYQRYLQQVADGTPGRLIINDSGRTRMTCDHIAAQVERNSPDIVFVDYLTLMRLAGGGDWLEVSQLTADLKTLAVDLDVPIVVASQLNRSATSHEHPGVEHLAQSDSVGRDADAVITMKRMSDRVMRLKLAKWRHGRDGFTFWVEYRPGQGVIDEITGQLATDMMDEDRAQEDGNG